MPKVKATEFEKLLALFISLGLDVQTYSVSGVCTEDNVVKIELENVEFVLCENTGKFSYLDFS